MLKFEKPDYKVKEYIKNNFYGKFEIEPLERGFGTTLGNALRRVMLSSLPGDAVTSIKIDGVAHEFQKIDGVIEDVTAIVLNIKSLVIKNHSNDYNNCSFLFLIYFVFTIQIFLYIFSRFTVLLFFSMINSTDCLL